MLAELGTPLERCVSLVVDDDEVVARLIKRAEIEGRADDNEETIRNRMRVYREQTEPLAAYYGERSLLRDVEGKGSIEDVAGRVRGALA